jgi:hypothetical protein
MLQCSRKNVSRMSLVSVRGINKFPTGQPGLQFAEDGCTRCKVWNFSDVILALLMQMLDRKPKLHPPDCLQVPNCVAHLHVQALNKAEPGQTIGPVVSLRETPSLIASFRSKLPEIQQGKSG